MPGLGSGESRAGKAWQGHVHGGSRSGGSAWPRRDPHPPNLRSLPTQYRDQCVGSARHPPTKPLRSEESTCRELLPVTPRKPTSRKLLHFQMRGVRRNNNFMFHKQRGRSRAEHSPPCAGTHRRSGATTHHCPLGGGNSGLSTPVRPSAAGVPTPGQGTPGETGRGGGQPNAGRQRERAG